ncbi:MAG: RyR domain-containing protein [Bacteroidota bacterium]
MNTKKDIIDKEWIGTQVEEYKKRYDNYVLFAEVLEKVLKEAAKKYAPLSIVQTRPKAIASFAEKCERKKTKYNDPVNQLTDLCGGRVIVHTIDEVKAVSAFIEKYFEIDYDNSIDVSQRLKPSEFGYRSVHYIISFKEGIFPNKSVNVEIPPLLSNDNNLNLKAEVQVRTILEHAWADLAHDLAYKSSFQIPVRWQREFAGVAAMLEGADKTFSRIKEGLHVYSTSYGAYMTEEQIQDEIKLLEIILEHDPKNVDLAGRIGKLAITIGSWHKAIDVLSGFTETDNAAILKDLGVALCKKYKDKPDSRGYKQGMAYLEQACNSPEADADALASLAGTWKTIDEEKARMLYRKAFQMEPSDPYPLENYLDMEITAARDTSIISLLYPVIFSAIKRCTDQADVGVNLPWAYYMTGKFYLLMDEPYESLKAYAKAVQLSTSPWMIDAALASLTRLKVVANELQGYVWNQRLLLTGKAIMTMRKARDAQQDLELAENDEEKVEKKKTLKEKIREAKSAQANITKLALDMENTIEPPLIIVAGGCDPSLEEQMKAYRNLLMEAFSDFKGTVISGGTMEGVSGLVGELGEIYRNTIHTIGYLPKLIPLGSTVDQRYTQIHETTGSGYSPFEALQYWIDIISTGIEPSEVRILGVNGGAISAIEYRLALAFGATVGLVEESGREVPKLLQDENWQNANNLIRLPADAMTLKAFIGHGKFRFKETLRQRMAREIHEEYRRTKQDSITTDDPAMLPWEELSDGFKESSAQQADHMINKLKMIGYTVEEVTDREINLVSFTGDEIELLAEIEHGRWNVERLLEGWTWAEKKNAGKKESPYLVSWSKLPEEVKEWDRAAVRIIPDLLKSVHLEIRKIPK